VNTSHGYVEDANPFLTRKPKLLLDDNDQKNRRARVLKQRT